MGQGNSAELICDTVDSDAFLQQQLAHHEVVRLAFDKCATHSTTEVNSLSADGARNHLSEEERACVNEYAALYAAQFQKGFLQFNSLFDQFQQRAMEKARQDHLERLARENLRK